MHHFMFSKLDENELPVANVVNNVWRIINEDRQIMEGHNSLLLIQKYDYKNNWRKNLMDY